MPEFKNLGGLPVIGTVADLDGIVQSMKPHWIILATSAEDGEISERLISILLHSGVHLRSAADIYEELTGKVPIDLVSPRYFLGRHDFRPRSGSMVMNRLLSIFVSMAGLIVAAPAMIAISVAIKLDSPGPVLFVQDRAGFEGRRLALLKFRTMRFCSEQRSVWAADNCDRITRVGKWLRRFRLDELPQLFNVLRGDMNLVGPRPHPSPSSELVALISRNLCISGTVVPYYSMRSMVKPGITGWAQVRYKYANGIGEELEKLRYDLYYVKHYSLWLDLRILFLTVGVIFKGGALDRENDPAGPSGSPEPAPGTCVKGIHVQDGLLNNASATVAGEPIVAAGDAGKGAGART